MNLTFKSIEEKQISLTISYWGSKTFVLTSESTSPVESICKVLIKSEQLIRTCSACLESRTTSPETEPPQRSGLSPICTSDLQNSLVTRTGSIICTTQGKIKIWDTFCQISNNLKILEVEMQLEMRSKCNYCTVGSWLFLLPSKITHTHNVMYTNDLS